LAAYGAIGQAAVIQPLIAVSASMLPLELLMGLHNASPPTNMPKSPGPILCFLLASAAQQLLKTVVASASVRFNQPPQLLLVLLVMSPMTSLKTCLRTCFVRKRPMHPF
jgi:hypothetical protein